MIIYINNRAYDPLYDMYVDEFDDATEEEVLEYLKRIHITKEESE